MVFFSVVGSNGITTRTKYGWCTVMLYDPIDLFKNLLGLYDIIQQSHFICFVRTFLLWPQKFTWMSVISSNGWQLGMKCKENVDSFGYLHSKPKIKVFGCLMLKIISSTASKTKSIVKWTLNIVIKNCDTCTCTQMYTITWSLHQYGLTVTGWRQWFLCDMWKNLNKFVLQDYYIWHSFSRNIEQCDWYTFI
jgi:hypothetical protein